MPSATAPSPWYKQYSVIIPALIVIDALISIAIVLKVPYTEIDWVAYMQEVEGFLSGELDYVKLKGDTGPLVYPAGFVYLFSGLYYLTDLGNNLILAQWIWAALYLAVTWVAMKLYQRAGAPPLLLPILILSKRIHSIFMLRMFNDCVAMALAYASFYVLLRPTNQGAQGVSWTTASVLYSLGVSIKMNLFLFAPAIFFIWMTCLGTKRTLFQIAVCAAVQLALGAPFLLHNWKSYISKAFELSRVFTYKWTVNLKFLPEDVFVASELGHCLLLFTLLCWFLVWRKRWVQRTPHLLNMKANAVLGTLFECNLIGIAFSRTLHYQFYSWFFHQVPFVLYFSCHTLPAWLRLAMIAGIEVAFNVYPATWWSSAMLTASLWVIAISIVITQDRKVAVKRS